MNNQVTFIGYVGTEPVAKTFDENKVVKFSLGVREYTSKSDEEKTMWLDVDAWNGLGERVLQYVTVGREVVIYGRLAINTYPKKVDGIEVKVSKPVVKLTGFHLCGPKPTDSTETTTETSNKSIRKLTAVKG